MERRLNKKVNDFVHTFKTDLVEKIKSYQSSDKENDMMDLINYVYQYDNLEINKEDLMKRKRVKSTVPCQRTLATVLLPGICVHLA